MFVQWEQIAPEDRSVHAIQLIERLPSEPIGDLLATIIPVPPEQLEFVADLMVSFFHQTQEFIRTPVWNEPQEAKWFLPLRYALDFRDQAKNLREFWAYAVDMLAAGTGREAKEIKTILNDLISGAIQENLAKWGAMGTVFQSQIAHSPQLTHAEAIQSVKEEQKWRQTNTDRGDTQNSETPSIREENEAKPGLFPSNPVWEDPLDQEKAAYDRLKLGVKFILEGKLLLDGREIKAPQIKQLLRQLISDRGVELIGELRKRLPNLIGNRESHLFSRLIEQLDDPSMLRLVDQFLPGTQAPMKLWVNALRTWIWEDHLTEDWILRGNPSMTPWLFVFKAIWNKSERSELFANIWEDLCLHITASSEKTISDLTSRLNAILLAEKSSDQQDLALLQAQLRRISKKYDENTPLKQDGDELLEEPIPEQKTDFEEKANSDPEETVDPDHEEIDHAVDSEEVEGSETYLELLLHYLEGTNLYRGALAALAKQLTPHKHKLSSEHVRRIAQVVAKQLEKPNRIQAAEIGRRLIQVLNSKEIVLLIREMTASFEIKTKSLFEIWIQYLSKSGSQIRMLQQFKEPSPQFSLLLWVFETRFNLPPFNELLEGSLFRMGSTMDFSAKEMATRLRTFLATQNEGNNAQNLALIEELDRFIQNPNQAPSADSKRIELQDNPLETSTQANTAKSTISHSPSSEKQDSIREMEAEQEHVEENEEPTTFLGELVFKFNGDEQVNLSDSKNPDLLVNLQDTPEESSGIPDAMALANHEEQLTSAIKELDALLEYPGFLSGSPTENLGDLVPQLRAHLQQHKDRAKDLFNNTSSHPNSIQRLAFLPIAFTEALLEAVIESDQHSTLLTFFVKLHGLFLQAERTAEARILREHSLLHFGAATNPPEDLPNYLTSIAEYLSQKSALAREEILRDLMTFTSEIAEELELEIAPTLSAWKDEIEAFSDQSQKEVKFPEEKADPHPAASSEAIPIDNAGMFIIFAILPAILKNVGYLEPGNDFKDEATRIRAASWLRYLIRPDNEGQPKDESLLRILMGLNEESELLPGKELSESEMSMAHQTLSAILESWPGMEELGTDEFRKNWLQRRGQVYAEKVHQWKLFVKRRGMDGLIDRLPWPYQQFQAPWTANKIQVSWNDVEG